MVKGLRMAGNTKAAVLISALALCAGLLSAKPSQAQSAADCIAPQVQQLMNACAAKEYRAADADLNTAWKSAKSFADAIGQGTELLTAQRAWLAYRDAACEVHESAYEGGSLQPLVLATCLSKLTTERTAMLLELMRIETAADALL